MQENDLIDRSYAIDEVREMAYQFADMYFAFVSELREEFGEDIAKEIAGRVLYNRAKERAKAMIISADKLGIERIPDNIPKVSKVPYLGWVASLGVDHCPYGTAWNKRIAENPWFRSFARLYCDVTDTTIAEVFTGKYSHKLYKNVVLGDENCLREYFLSDKVKEGIYSYDPERAE